MARKRCPKPMHHGMPLQSSALTAADAAVSHYVAGQLASCCMQVRVRERDVCRYYHPR